MDIRKLQKAPQVAKYFILSLILPLLTFQAASGQKLSGKFSEQTSYGKQVFNFVDGRFEHRISGDIAADFGRGRYSLKNGVLTLNYEAIISGRDSSNYTLAYRAGALPFTVVSFKILDETKSPTTGRLFFRDKFWNMIAVSESSKEGLGTVWITHNSIIRYLVLESRGYNSVVISIDRLRKAHYDLIADMVPSVTEYISPKVVKYKVLKFTPTELRIAEENMGSIALFREK